MALTIETLEQKIRARVMVMDSLIEKRDWQGVQELAEECLRIERQQMLIEAQQRATLPRGKHGCDD